MQLEDDTLRALQMRGCGLWHHLPSRKEVAGALRIPHVPRTWAPQVPVHIPSPVSFQSTAM